MKVSHVVHALVVATGEHIFMHPCERMHRRMHTTTPQVWAHLHDVSLYARTTRVQGTGRIGSQQQLARGVIGGVLEVPSGLVGTIYTQSNLGFMKHPCFEKLADFS